MSKRILLVFGAFLVGLLFFLRYAGINPITVTAIGLLILILILFYFMGQERRQPVMRLIDSDGQARSTIDVGESLIVSASGLRPATVHDLVLLDSEGGTLLVSRAMSNSEGVIMKATIWPQMGFEDLSSEEVYTFEQAQEIWRGRNLQVQVRLGNRVLMESEIRFPDVFERPLLLSTGPEGVIRNGIEAGTQDAIVSGYNMPFEGDARVFMVVRQHDWQLGDLILTVTLGKSVV